MKKQIALGTRSFPVQKVVRILLPEIRSLIETARQHTASAANLTMVSLYWNIGRLVGAKVEDPHGRASYGQQVIERLSTSLVRDYGRGFSISNLWDMRRFYALFQILQTLSVESWSRAHAAAGGRIGIDLVKHFTISWSHYRLLISQNDDLRRRFYFDRTAGGRWSVRELARQIDGALFERVGLSSDTKKLAAIEKRKPLEKSAVADGPFKDPYLLDFLGLTGAYSEKDLEASVIANLQQFLTELGNDFCFIRRQFPMRIDDQDYFLDLLFYHRGLKCLVAIDLKIGAFTAADKGQMDLYLAWLKRQEWRRGENEPVGLILCASKRRQHVELLLAGGPHKMHVSEYVTRLPKKRILEERLKLYGRLVGEGYGK